jgi:hypothetical protein
MGSLSDSFLSVLSSWLQWIAIVGIGFGLLSGVGLFYVNKEVSSRQEQRLAEAHQQIANLQPKSLKTRVLDFINRLDKDIVPAIDKRQLVFERSLTYAQLAELQNLCQEDKDNKYVKLLPTTNMIQNEPGKQGGIKFQVTEELLK